MISRRTVLASIAAAAAPVAAVPAAARFGPLVEDRNQILDLPQGFGYRVIATAGETMDDGLKVPPRADGMAAFATGSDRILLVCNHENHPAREGAFGPDNELLPSLNRALLYDAGGGITPGTGGTTTLGYEPSTGRVLSRQLSLAGTEVNCAGGATPWGSWLSCEECFESPGVTRERGRDVHREQRHGYVFEVDPRHPERADTEPLTAMGRFEHEAAAVDPHTGTVYLTEDKHRSLFYRFLPRVPGRLAEGGRLQALAIQGRPGFDTRNWENPDRMPVGTWFPADWVDIREPDPAVNEVRLAGYEDGAARFARGEGLTLADGSLFMTATIGGEHRLGQIFEYRPRRGSGGRLRLLVESGPEGVLRNADNLTMAPWGDLIVCEDTAGSCGLIGVAVDGNQYVLARNSYSGSELAGICFAPDGKTMFVNVQERGLTLAITGPW